MLESNYEYTTLSISMTPEISVFLTFNELEKLSLWDTSDHYPPVPLYGGVNHE